MDLYAAVSIGTIWNGMKLWGESKEHSSTSFFNSFEVNPKCWSAFLKEGGICPRQPTSATMHFSFQLSKPWSVIIFSYFPVFSSFQKAILSSIGTMSSGPTKQIFLLRDMNKESTRFVIWQISWGKCFIENALSTGSSKKTVQLFEVATSP